MTHLAGLSLNLSYRTGRNDLVQDFFVPCLESSTLYRRAAGYFTSAGLALAARGVASLAARRGKMQLVVSPHLEQADVETLLAAHENPASALKAIAARSLADIEDALIKDRLNALAWLSATGLLEIKLALRMDVKGAYSRGIFHAALTLACKVAEKNRPLMLIVVCPFINLCRQWIREIAAFGLKAIACFEGRNRWQEELEEGYQCLAGGLASVQAIVTTNATFQSEGFQNRLRPRVAAGTIHHLLIADEVHNLGAERIRMALPDGIALRLGLSATPERHYDPVGTSAVLSYFGGTVYEYTLPQAIADGRLCPYRYYPVPAILIMAQGI